MPIDVRRCLVDLAEQRPVFHSEADFQHSLAWTLHLAEPQARVRLETRPARGMRLDLLVEADGHRVAIELKYLVRRFHGEIAGELFDLPNQAAHDIARYDVVKDVVRVESFLATGVADEGWVIAMSNDPAYWQPGRKQDAVDARFRLHEGRILEGELDWGPAAGAGTTRGRENALELAGRYRCTWRDFASVVDLGGQPVQWRYLAIGVPAEELTGSEPAPQSGAATARPHRARAAAGSSTIRDEVLTAALSPTGQSPDGTVSPAEVIAECCRRGSTYADATIRTHVTSVMCVEAPQHHHTVYPDLERAGQGRYRLHDERLGGVEHCGRGGQFVDERRPRESGLSRLAAGPCEV